MYAVRLYPESYEAKLRIIFTIDMKPFLGHTKQLKF